jgi:hypothetical protein
LKEVDERTARLCDGVVGSISLRGTDFYKANFSLDLMKECFIVAKEYNLPAVKKAATTILLSKIRDGHSDLAFNKECFTIAEEYQVVELIELKEADENWLLNFQQLTFSSQEM